MLSRKFTRDQFVLFCFFSNSTRYHFIHWSNEDLFIRGYNLNKPVPSFVLSMLNEFRWDCCIQFLRMIVIPVGVKQKRYAHIALVDYRFWICSNVKIHSLCFYLWKKDRVTYFIVLLCVNLHDIAAIAKIFGMPCDITILYIFFCVAYQRDTFPVVCKLSTIISQLLRLNTIFRMLST